MKKLLALPQEIQNASQVQHQPIVQSCVLCGGDHTTGNVSCRVNCRRRPTTWEIKIAKEIMAISIKDGILILAWDKLDRPTSSNNNNPSCIRGK